MALPGEEVIGWYTAFDKDNFSMWKLRMLTFLHALDYDMPDIIADDRYVPAGSSEDGKSSVRNKPHDQWTDEEKRLDHLNAKAKWYIINALPNEVLCFVQNCCTAKEMLDALSKVYEGTEELKEAKKDILIREYECFSAYEGETLTQTYTRFLRLVSDLRCADVKKDDDELIRKFTLSLPDQWNLMIKILRFGGRMKTMTLADLYGALMSHELLEGLKDIGMNDMVKGPTKGSLLTKPATMVPNSEEESEDGYEDDGELEILAKKVALQSRKLRNLTQRRKLAKSKDCKKKPKADQQMNNP